LAFVTKSAASGRTDLEMFDLDTSKETLLTSDATVEGDPAWSPDGAKMAFWRQQGTNQDVWVVDIDDAVAAAAAGPAVKLSGTQLTNDPANDADPAWSPDGQFVGFASQRAGNWDIFVIRIDSGQLAQLTSDPSDEQVPSGSPDGSEIAFMSNRDDPSSPEIYVMVADGSNVRRVTNHAGFDGHPTWRSPRSA
jgi:TolB protein